MKYKDYFLFFIALFFISIGLWIVKNFDHPSFEQIIYHLQFGVEGINALSKNLITKFIKACILGPLLLTLILVFRKRIAYIFEKIISLIINNSIVLLLLAVIVFAYNIKLYEYLRRNFSKDDYFAANYINPKDIAITQIIKPKNLILIYVESLENSFRDSEIFSENLLIKLDEIPGISFENYRQSTGAEWTVAGIVATQCGVPLKTFFSKMLESVNYVLANTICLGDILKEQGYKNIFVNGMDANFAGTGNFFSNHGYDEIYDKKEILAKGFTYEYMKSIGNGIHDNDIFNLAKSIITENEQGNIPYNLTILTLDTHFPEGTPSEQCKYKNKKQLERSVLCTVDALVDLVNYIKIKGYLDNTDIVILGDHLFMANDQQKINLFYKDRKIYNLFISNDKLIPNRSEILHFDMFPTILYKLGFLVPDGKVGLGYSGFGDYKIHPSPDRYIEMNEKLLNYSKKYLDLWKIKK